MKTIAWLALALLCGAVTGCTGSGSSSGPAGGSGRTGPSTSINPPAATTGHAKFAYTGNQGASLSGYSVNTNTGALTALPGFPLALGNNPTVVTHDPQNRFLIVADIAASLLYSFTINSTTGALTQVSTLPAVKEPVAAIVDPSGTHVYFASMGSNFVGAYALSSAGVLTPVAGQPFATNGSQDFGNSIAMNAAGTALYVQDDYSLYVYSIDVGTGALTLTQTFSDGNNFGGGLAIDPNGKYLYEAEAGLGRIAAYAIQGTQLTLAKTSTGTQGAYTFNVSPTGQYAYASEGPVLEIFTIDDGAFTLVGRATGVYAQQIAFDPTGSFLYLPQGCSANCPGGVYNVINEFTIGSEGALTAVPGGPAAAGVTPWGMTMTTQ